MQIVKQGLTSFENRAINPLTKHGGGLTMEVPIHQKYILSIPEASQYFGLGYKWMRKFAERHPEVAMATEGRVVGQVETVWTWLREGHVGRI